MTEDSSVGHVLAAILPRRSTAVIFITMFFMWLPILTDLFDAIEAINDALATVLLIALVLGCFGLTGLYGAIASARRSPALRDRTFFTLIVLRGAVLSGAALGLAVLLGDVFD